MRLSLRSWSPFPCVPCWSCSLLNRLRCQGFHGCDGFSPLAEEVEIWFHFCGWSTPPVCCRSGASSIAAQNAKVDSVVPIFRHSQGWTGFQLHNREKAIKDRILRNCEITVPALTAHHAHMSFADLLLKQVGRFRRVLAYCTLVAEATLFRIRFIGDLHGERVLARWLNRQRNACKKMRLPPSHRWLSANSPLIGRRAKEWQTGNSDEHFGENCKRLRVHKRLPDGAGKSQYRGASLGQSRASEVGCKATVSDSLGAPAWALHVYVDSRAPPNELWSLNERSCYQWLGIQCRRLLAGYLPDEMIQRLQHCSSSAQSVCLCIFWKTERYGGSIWQCANIVRVKQHVQGRLLYRYMMIRHIIGKERVR